MEMDIRPLEALAMYLGRNIIFWSMISIAIGMVMQHVAVLIFRLTVGPASICVRSGSPLSTGYFSSWRHHFFSQFRMKKRRPCDGPNLDWLSLGSVTVSRLQFLKLFNGTLLLYKVLEVIEQYLEMKMKNFKNFSIPIVTWMTRTRWILTRNLELERYTQMFKGFEFLY